VSPEPEINITHNTCFMPPGSICHFASEMAQPVANAPHSPFAIRFSVKIRQVAAFACFAIGKCECVCHSLQRYEWQSLWRMHRIRQTKATTGETKI
jgi:hypothetical protein